MKFFLFQPYFSLDKCEFIEWTDRVAELCTRDSLMTILNSKELSNLGIGQRTKQKINASYPHPSFHPCLEECGKCPHPHYSLPFLCPTHSQAHRYERTGICKPVNASFVYRLFPKHARACRLFNMSAVQPWAWVTASDWYFFLYHCICCTAGSHSFTCRKRDSDQPEKRITVHSEAIKGGK